MLNRRRVIISFLTFLVSLGVHAQKEILLWPGGAPGSQGKTSKEKVRIAETGDHVITNIHFPSITIYLPKKELNTGTAIVIAPGGGHRELWIDHEGYNVAKWFCDRGVAAFVLKYRLAKQDSSAYTIEGNELADMQRAIRLVRSKARDWLVDTGKLALWVFLQEERWQHSPLCISIMEIRVQLIRLSDNPADQLSRR